MLDRGLARGFHAQVEREAGQARDRGLEQSRTAGQRRDLRRSGHIHRRSGLGARLRRRDLRRADRGGRGARVGAHRRRGRARSPGIARRPRGAAAGHQRLRARSRRADAAAGPLQRRLLAGAGPRAARGHGGARVARRARGQDGVLPLADPLGRSPGLRAGGPHLRRGRLRSRALGRAAAHRSRGCLGARAGARAGRRAGRRLPGAGVLLRRSGARVRDARALRRRSLIA